MKYFFFAIYFIMCLIPWFVSPFTRLWEYWYNPYETKLNSNDTGALYFLIGCVAWLATCPLYLGVKYILGLKAFLIWYIAGGIIHGAILYGNLLWPEWSDNYERNRPKKKHKEMG